MKNSKSKILEFKSTGDPVNVLETFISYNHVKNVKEIFFYQNWKNENQTKFMAFEGSYAIQ